MDSELPHDAPRPVDSDMYSDVFDGCWAQGVEVELPQIAHLVVERQRGSSQTGLLLRGVPFGLARQVGAKGLAQLTSLNSAFSQAVAEVKDGSRSHTWVFPGFPLRPTTELEQRHLYVRLLSGRTIQRETVRGRRQACEHGGRSTA